MTGGKLLSQGGVLKFIDFTHSTNLISIHTCFNRVDLNLKMIKDLVLQEINDKKITLLLEAINENSEIITKEELSTKWNEHSGNLKPLLQTLNLENQAELIEKIEEQFLFLSLNKEITFKVAEILDFEILELNKNKTAYNAE